MMGDAFGEITERLRRFTVQVRTGGNSCGSGVVWSTDGQVLTNAHVLRESRFEVELWDGRRFPARVLKKDRRADLASLRVETQDLPSAVPGDSDALRPGELVIAVGNPLGFIGAVSTGVVHSVGSLAGFSPQRWIVSDVRLAPGNSGGPLANAQGQVIGINTMITGGLALAIPSRSAARFLAQPATNPVRLGVTVRPVPLDRSVGLLVLEIAPQSSAARASLLPGDLLIGVNGRPFRSTEDLEDALLATRGQIEIEFERGGSGRTRRVAAQIAIEPVRAA
jgi:serine protease Do